MAVVVGKSYYAKVLGDPPPAYDPTETEWSIDVTVDAEARKNLEELGLDHKIQSPTHNMRGEERGKPHESGSEFIKFSRRGEKQDGTPAKPIRIIDKQKNPWPEDKLIGNGSKVAVSFAVNEGEYRGKPWKKPGILGIMVLDHVPYEKDEFDAFVESGVDDFDDAPFDDE